MSEAKRIALTPVAVAAAAAAAAVASAPAKKDKPKPEPVKTQRFVLTLAASTEQSCPEFNFADLIHSVAVSSLYLNIYLQFHFL